jgi:DNA-binding helix-turn-helix protein
MNTDIDFKISMIFRNRLADFVAESDDKKTDLPSLIGINKDIFIRALNSGILPSTKTLAKIADFFDTSIEYLIGISENDRFIKLNPPNCFSQRLHELKKEKNVKACKIATDLGFARSLFTSWKKNNYIPSLEIIYSLSCYFHVSIDYLLGRTDDRVN